MIAKLRKDAGKNTISVEAGVAPAIGESGDAHADDDDADSNGDDGDGGNSKGGLGGLDGFGLEAHNLVIKNKDTDKIEAVTAENSYYDKERGLVLGKGQSDNSVTPFLPRVCSRALVDCFAPIRGLRRREGGGGN